MLRSSDVLALTHFAPAVYSVTAVFLWGAADFAGGYGSRRANAFVLTAFSHLCAFALMFTIALANRGAFPGGLSIVWALAAGASGGFSLAIFYRALASGQMGVTAPGARRGAGGPSPSHASGYRPGRPPQPLDDGRVYSSHPRHLAHHPSRTDEQRRRRPKGFLGPPCRCWHSRPSWRGIRRLLSLHPPGD